MTNRGYVRRVEEWLGEIVVLWDAHPAVALAVLALAAALEYVFPPFPGDAVAVVGAFLATASGGNLAPILAATLLGTLAGVLVDVRIGRAVASRRERLPERSRAVLDDLVAKFVRHGAVYLVVNRFLPGVRAFFFVAAGVAGVPLPRVVLWSMVSAAAWNALLVALGMLAGRNLERLEAIVATYQQVIGVALGVGLVFYLVRWRLRRRAARRIRGAEAPRTDPAAGGPRTPPRS